MAANVGDVLRKTLAGEPLSDDEKAVRREKAKEAMRRSKRIYFPSQEMMQSYYEAAAAAQSGRAKPDFSAWVVEQLDLALSGTRVDATEWGALHENLEQAKLDLETAERRAEQYRDQRDDANTQLADLTERMISVMESLGLPAGGR